MSFVYSVSSLNTNSSSINKKEELSEATKKKLKALNIDVSSVTSETEAKRIIAEEEAKKSEKTDTKQAEAGSQEEKLYNRINRANVLAQTRPQYQHFQSKYMNCR